MRGCLFGACACAVAWACADTAFTAGEWEVAFSAEGQSLRLAHRASGAEIVGELAFMGPDEATDVKSPPKCDWKIVDARDRASRRLAVTDGEGDERGFIAFQANGAKVSFLVYHRPGLAYQGELSFTGDVRYRDDAFAASTTPGTGERVLQLVSGEADSELHDALFSAGADEALQFDVPGLRLVTGGRGVFSFECAGRIEKPGEAVFAFNVERGYYRNRWGAYGGVKPSCTNACAAGGRPVGTAGAWARVLERARCTANQIFAGRVVVPGEEGGVAGAQRALAREQARVEATVAALAGRKLEVGEASKGLAPERVRLHQQGEPACAVRPGALSPCFGMPPVWDLHLKRPFGDWHVVALFNWGDEPAIVGFDWDEIGEPAERAFVCWEFWTESWQGVNLEHVEMQLPARSVRLLALQPYQGHPQVLTSDRHLTQGGVELKDQRWAEDRLEATVGVVGGFASTVRFAVPESFAFRKLDASAGVRAEARVEAGGKVVAVTLASETTRDVKLVLGF